MKLTYIKFPGVRHDVCLNKDCVVIRKARTNMILVDSCVLRLVNDLHKSRRIRCK